MVDALIVSNLVLWGLVVVLAAVVVALVRQVGVLHERVAPVGALAVGGGPAPGEAAPVVDAVDWAGRPVRVGARDADGRSTLLLFLSPSCPVCRTLLPVLESARTAERSWLNVVVASDGPRSEHEEFVGRHRLDLGTYVLSAELGLAWRVGQLPYAALLDEEGVVLAAGLVNTREHLESLFEARERGVPSLQEYLKKGGRSRRVA